jgi:hypothetical protein
MPTVLDRCSHLFHRAFGVRPQRSLGESKPKSFLQHFENPSCFSMEMAMDL